MLFGSISMKTDISYSHISMWYTIKDVNCGPLQHSFFFLSPFLNPSDLQRKLNDVEYFSCRTNVKKPHKAIHLHYCPHDAYNGTRHSHTIGKYPLPISSSAGTVDRKKCTLKYPQSLQRWKKTVKRAVTKYMKQAFETTIIFRTNHLHLKKTSACWNDTSTFTQLSFSCQHCRQTCKKAWKRHEKVVACRSLENESNQYNIVNFRWIPVLFIWQHRPCTYWKASKAHRKQ